MKIFKKNPPKWSRSEMVKEIEIFSSIYKERPIKNNIGGMMFPHMFAFYFILKKIKPDFVVESGVYKGQSTWLIERTLPNTNILSIDLDFSNIVYKSKKAKYSSTDFKYQDFSKLAKNSLVFFDDHQNALDRLKQSKNFKFKHMIYEDNYCPGTGDCYSFKKIILNSGSVRELSAKDIKKTLKKILKELLKKKFNKNYVPKIEMDKLKYIWKLDDVSPNKNDKKFFVKNIYSYFEFPPIFKTFNTRWHDEWNDKKYPTETPLLDFSYKKKYKKAYKEAMWYTWIAYLKLL